MTEFSASDLPSDSPTDLTTTPTTTPAPSGAQWTIRAGDYAATIVEVGGGLRELTYAGQDIVAGYPVERMADAARGNLLVPWPNRIRDGKYQFDGHDYQLPLTEPKLHNASHGLVRWANFTLLEQHADRLRVGLTVHPSSGWAWTLRVEVEYHLTADGLTITPHVTNLSASACPFGFGAHPYLRVGDLGLDDVRLTAAVTEEITVDDRMLPTGTRPAEHDFARGQHLAGIALDTAYRAPAVDGSGRWCVDVVSATPRTPDGVTPGVRLWADGQYQYVQLFTGDGLPEPQRRQGLAVEPMTCPANAFNSGEGLIRLEPGASFSAPFGISALT